MAGRTEYLYECKGCRARTVMLEKRAPKRACYHCPCDRYYYVATMVVDRDAAAVAGTCPVLGTHARVTDGSLDR